MGLDVTFYSNLRKIDSEPTYDAYDEREDWDETFYAWRAYVNSDDFPGWAEGLEADAVYKYSKVRGFRAGSYSGYAVWRNMLSTIVLGVSPDIVWSNPKEYKDKPFYRLINFSDCEGFIGPVHCEQLYEDFLAHEETIGDGPMWFRNKYKEWLKCLSIFEGDCCLDFH